MAPTDGKPVEKNPVEEPPLGEQGIRQIEDDVPPEPAAAGRGKAARKTPERNRPQRGRARSDRAGNESDSVYFMPGEAYSESRVREILAAPDDADYLRLLENILQYALWDDIWSYLDQPQIEAAFPRLDLPAGVGQAWASWLKRTTQG